LNTPSDKNAECVKNVRWNLTLWAVQKAGEPIQKKFDTPALKKIWDGLALGGKISVGAAGVVGIGLLPVLDYFRGATSDFDKTIEAVERCLDHRDGQMFRGLYQAAVDQLFTIVPKTTDKRTKEDKLTRQEEELCRIEHCIEARIEDVAEWKQDHALMFETWGAVVATRLTAVGMMEEMKLVDKTLPKQKMTDIKRRAERKRLLHRYIAYRNSQLEYSGGYTDQPLLTFNPRPPNRVHVHYLEDKHTGQTRRGAHNGERFDLDRVKYLMFVALEASGLWLTEWGQLRQIVTPLAKQQGGGRGWNSVSV